VTFPLYLEIDQIYNLACPASPIHYQHDPVQTTKTSVHGAINMPGLAKRVRAKILQASTSEVYGDPSVHPQGEDYWGHVNPIGPRSCYDEGKRCAETLFFDYWRQHKLPIKVPRIFNTYGPRMHPNDGRVISNFIVQALLGRDITVFGDGLQTRSFCYVDDLIDGLMRLMNTSHDVIGPINLGNPKEFTILELASLVIELTGSRSVIVHRRRPQDDPRQRRPDISKANDLLSWGAEDPISGRTCADHRIFRNAAERRHRARVHHSRSNCRSLTPTRYAAADLRQQVFLSRSLRHESNSLRPDVSLGRRRV
jgi:UDP-glucuronate decarboxylase